MTLYFWVSGISAGDVPTRGNTGKTIQFAPGVYPTQYNANYETQVGGFSVMIG